MVSAILSAERGLIRVSRTLRNLLCGVAVCGVALASAFPLERPQQSAASGTSLAASTRNLESSYMENKGQWNADALFVTRTPGMHLWVTRTGMVMDVHQTIEDQRAALSQLLSEGAQAAPKQRVGHVVRMDFVAATEKVRTLGRDPLATRVDYLTLERPGAGFKDIKAYAEVEVQNVAPGVNARFYRDRGQPRYDLIVAPGVNPSNVALRIQGAEQVVVNEDGTLSLRTSLGWMRKTDLFVYQQANGRKAEISSRFRVEQRGSDFFLRFDLGKIDTSKPVVIDPLVYGTHFGGDADIDEVTHVVSDGAGNTFFTGWTTSIDLPVNVGPYGVELKDSIDGFFAQLSGDVFDATYVAYVNSQFDDWGRFVQVDQYGNVWMVGTTRAAQFPGRLDIEIGVPNGAQAPIGGNIAFRYRGVQTAPIVWNATAAQVSTALNALADGPAGGFTVTGGPLPGTPIRIRTTDPATGVLQLIARPKPYVVAPVPPAPPVTTAATQSIDIQFAQVGLIPFGGTFSLSVVDNTQTFTTGGIAFNATGAAIQTALQALQPLAGTTPARVTAVGGALMNTAPAPGVDGAVVNVNFFDTASVPQPRPIMTLNSAGIQAGTYAVLNSTVNAFVTKFTKTATGVDPFVAPAQRVTNLINAPVDLGLAPGPDTVPWFSDNGITGFALRRVTTATGNVEMVIAGNGTQIADIVGPVPTGATWGYFYTLIFNPTNNTLTVDAARSQYVGGQATVSVSGATMDAEGAIYLSGTVEMPSAADPLVLTNQILGPTSNIFRTTNGVFTGGNLLRQRDAFVRKYSNTGALTYSATIGGSQNDFSDGIAIDASNSPYVLVRTQSFNYPRTLNVFGPIFPGGSTLLAVTKLNSTASQILYSTSLRSTVAAATSASFDIAVDSKANAYVSGVVTRPMTGPIPIPLTPIAPAVPGQLPALDSTLPNSTTDAFITVLNSTASGLLYSSLIGEDASFDYVNGMSIDRTGALYLAGTSVAVAIGPIGLPIDYLSPLAFKLFPDGWDGWSVKLKVVQPILDGIVVTPVDVAGGLGSTANVQVFLRSPAPVGGAQVTLRLSNPAVARFNNAASGPTNVRITIPEGAQTFSSPVTVFTRTVSNATFVDIRAELDGDFVQTRMNVRPWLDSFTLGTTSVAGGENVSATITSFQAAPAGGLTVDLTANSALVAFPGSGQITIPAGQRSVTFDIATLGVDVNTDVDITASLAGVGITQTLQLTPPLISSLTISPDRVTGGASTTATVQIQGLAGPNTVVTLGQTGSPVTIPATIQIPQGQDSATFTIETGFVPANTSATISASLNGDQVTDTVFIENNSILSVTLSQTTVTGGALVTGQINLARPTGLTGLTVPLTNSNPGAGTITPASVFIAPGSTTGTFQIQTNPSASNEVLVVATNLTGYVQRQATLNINAIVISFSLSVAPPQLTGGAQATGTITLNTASPINLTINLSSNDPVATFPNGTTVVIPAGQVSRTFPIATGQTLTTRDVTISAELFGTTRTAPLRVFPPAVSSFVISPNVVLGGGSSTGTITLDQPAPAGGLIINLSTNNPLFVTHPASITIPGGASQGTFPITTTQVTRQITVRFTANVPARGQNIDALLTINPRP